MAGNKNSVVPQEYVDKMLEFDIEAWRQQKIADALKYQAERNTGAEPPDWFGADENYYSEKFGQDWMNCLATATDPYGEKCYESYNPSFAKNYKQKGFMLLTDADDEQLGDIYIDHYSNLNENPDALPIHAITLTGLSNDGKRKFTYGDGSRNTIKKNANYPLQQGYYKRYRFIGTPDEIAQIEAHNAKVRDFQEKTAPLREDRKITPLKTDSLDKRNTAEWLAGFVKNKNK
jgi:hypothetical protein